MCGRRETRLPASPAVERATPGATPPPPRREAQTIRGVSLNHLVGSRDQRRRHGEAKCLCGPQVDHKLVFGWSLHRQVRRLLALKDAINVTGHLPGLVDEIRRTGDTGAVGD